MIGLERNVRAEKFLGQPLEQSPGEQAVQIALVREYDFRFGQLRHGDLNLIEMRWHGERGFVPSEKTLKAAGFQPESASF
jgi:hypothetical protein